MQLPVGFRFLTALTACSFVAGCATAAGSSSAPNASPEVLIDASGRVYRTTEVASTASYPVSADSTFRALVGAYSALGIEPSRIDPAERIVGRQGLIVRRQFQGERLSSMFDCGSNELGPRADDGRILVDITSRTTADGGGSTVMTTVEGAFTANDGVSRDPVRCVSNGRIEEMLRRETSLRLGVPYQRNH